MNNFRTDLERKAYLLLHNDGLVAFDARYGMAGSRLLNQWSNQGLVRVRSTPLGISAQTFKKYAGEAGCL